MIRASILLMLSCMVVSPLNAQYNFDFYCRDDTIKSGTTLIEFHFTLANTGSLPDSYAVDCRIIDSVPGWLELFCAGGSCSEPGQVLYDYLLVGESDTLIKISVWPTAGYGVEVINLHVRSLGNQGADSITVYAVGINAVEEKTMFNVTQAQMTIMPNPTSRACNVIYYIPVFTNVNISILNANGATVRKVVANKKCVGVHREKCDMMDLPKGVYFIYLEAGKMTEKKKVILAR